MRQFFFISLLLCTALSWGKDGSATPYRMAGPYAVIARDGEFRNSKTGSERDMKEAHEAALRGDTATARRICDAYAATLQRLDGHDAPLCAIQCYDLMLAMQQLKPSVEAGTRSRWNAMIRRALLPMMERFEQDSPYANGNWGAIVNRLRMACAIVMDDSLLYRAAVDYYLHGDDNGSLPNYVGPTGQCQETGRDQGHAQLGLGALCDICEMAWQQGDDLWGALDNRLLKGIEYTARYNLGEDVPFETWKDCTGLYCDWTEPGAMSRGKLWDIYRKPYEHYVGRRHLKMPWTRKAVKAQAKGATPLKEPLRLHAVYTAPAPEGAPVKNDYEVMIRPRGSEDWTPVATYAAKVNAPTANGKHARSEVSFGRFDFQGDVFVRVVTKKRKFRSARIRPDFRGVIANVINDSTLQFMLFQPEDISVEFDGDIRENLLLFTSRPSVSREEAETEARKQGRDFRYMAPGYYTGDIIVPSSTTLYMAPGCWLSGTLRIEDAHDVSILGRGIARPQDGYEGCHVHRSRRIFIEGLTVNTCPIGGSDSVDVRLVQCISYPAWGDGLNVFASSHINYERVFCRTSDDCTTVYATRKGFEGSASHITMRNAVLWADVAHPIFVGLHGKGSASAESDSITDVRYEHIDILGQWEPQVDYQGCLAVNAGDNNIVRRITFDNIRIENIACGALFHFKVSWNEKYCSAPGRVIEDITVRHVRYNGDMPYLSFCSGYDEQRNIRNLHFEHFKVNGRLLYDGMPGVPGWYHTSDFVPAWIGPNVTGVRFTK